MDENPTSAPEPTLSPGKWIGQVLAAVILAEGIWGFLASLTNNLLVPLLARVMDGDPQSPLYLGKGELNIPPLFNSVLALCLAGIVFVVLHQWSRRKSAPVRVKMVRVVKKVSQPAGRLSTTAPLSITAAPAPSAVPPQPELAPRISSAPVLPPPAPVQSKPTPPPAAPAKPGKPKPPKEVYYNLVGEPINPTEDD